MSENPSAAIFHWLATPFGQRLERQINRLARLPDVIQVAVMPDIHEGKRVPNGVAVAAEHRIYPELVGADIGCGISAIAFRETADRFRQSELRELLHHLEKVIPTLKQPAVVANQHHQTIQRLGSLSCERLTQQAGRDGRYQLGTLGRGNHFLELSSDSSGRLWGVVHTGSRAMGQYITDYHLNLAAGNDGHSLPSLDLRLPEGLAYLSDMQWACNYATASRQIILNRLADLLENDFGIGVDESSFIDSPHNIATVQTHQDRCVIVHRKSANIASPGRQGLIAGSMLVGTKIVIGLGHPDSLESSSHGAGRMMSRKQAAERLATRELTHCMRSVIWHDRLARRLIDESPKAYRELHEVMAAQRDLVKSIDTLVPLINDKRP
jgi:tRNA-splicing ligase RtcB